MRVFVSRTTMSAVFWLPGMKFELPTSFPLLLPQVGYLYPLWMRCTLYLYLLSPDPLTLCCFVVVRTSTLKKTLISMMQSDYPGQCRIYTSHTTDLLFRSVPWSDLLLLTKYFRVEALVHSSAFSCSWWGTCSWNLWCGTATWDFLDNLEHWLRMGYLFKRNLVSTSVLLTFEWSYCYPYFLGNVIFAFQFYFSLRCWPLLFVIRIR